MNSLLHTLFDRYPAELRPLQAPQPLGNAGGASGARLWRYRAAAGLLVAKVWPEGRLRSEVETIHAWVRRGEGLGFLAVPRQGLDGSSAQDLGGCVWEIAPWMPGEAEISEPPARARVLAAFEALAALHKVLGPGEGVAFSPGLAMRSREIEALPREVASLRLAVAGWPENPLTDLARRWMDAAERLGPVLAPRIRELASVPVRVQPVLRDARPDHFLFTGDRVSGLVDFGAMGIDAVSADLARLVAEWSGVRGDLQRNAIAAYEVKRPLDRAERDLIQAFDRSSALLTGSRWIRWHFVEKRRFDDPTAVERGMRRAVERIEALRGVLLNPGP